MTHDKTMDACVMEASNQNEEDAQLKILFAAGRKLCSFDRSFLCQKNQLQIATDLVLLRLLLSSSLQLCFPSSVLLQKRRAMRISMTGEGCAHHRRSSSKRSRKR